MQARIMPKPATARRTGRAAALTLLLGALMALATPLARAETVVFAIASSRSFDKRLPELQFADRDAERFADAMRRVGLVEAKSVVLLPAATRAAFWRAAYELRAKPDNGKAKGSRKLIMYFSGHADDGGLHLADGILKRSELHEFLGSLPFDSKVVLLDSCFSGRLAAKGVVEKEAFELPSAKVDEPTGTVFLTASSGLERAYESQEIGAGVFTHYVLDGLFGGADGNHDGLVTVDELYQYVYAETRRFGTSLPATVTQRPEFVAELKGRGALVVSYPTKAAGQVVLPAGLEGQVAFARRGGVGEYPVDKTAGAEMTVRLPEGRYDVSVRAGDRAGKARVVVRPAAEARLATDDFRWRQAPPPETLAGKGLERRAAPAQAAAGESAGRASELALLGGGQTGTHAYMQRGPYVEASYWSLGGGGRSGLGVGAIASYRTNALELTDGEGVAQTIMVGLGGTARLAFPSAWPRGSLGIALMAGEAFAGQQRDSETGDESFKANYPIAALGPELELALGRTFALGVAARRELHFLPEHSVAAAASVYGLSIRARFPGK
jgi:hypothetical protein